MTKLLLELLLAAACLDAGQHGRHNQLHQAAQVRLVQGAMLDGCQWVDVAFPAHHSLVGV